MANLDTALDKIKDSSAEVNNLGTAIKDDILEGSSALKDKVEDVATAAVEKSATVHQNILELVKANPYKSLATAVIVGWLIAKI